MILAVLLLATALVVAGYLVLYFSTQAQGRLQAFGKYLSYWVFLLAAIVIVGALSAPYFGGSPFGMRMMMRDHGMMRDHDGPQMRDNRPGEMMRRPMPQTPGMMEPQNQEGSDPSGPPSE